MVPDPNADIQQLPDVSETPVFTAAGNRLGDAVDLVVDLLDARAEAVLVDVETPPGDLPADADGVRVPYRYVAGVDDAIVLTVSLGLDDRTEGESTTDRDGRTGGAPTAARHDRSDVPGSPDRDGGPATDEDRNVASTTTTDEGRNVAGTTTTGESRTDDRLVAGESPLDGSPADDAGEFAIDDGPTDGSPADDAGDDVEFID